MENTAQCIKCTEHIVVNAGALTLQCLQFCWLRGFLDQDDVWESCMGNNCAVVVLQLRWTFYCNPLCRMSIKGHASRTAVGGGQCCQNWDLLWSKACISLLEGLWSWRWLMGTILSVQMRLSNCFGWMGGSSTTPQGCQEAMQALYSFYINVYYCLFFFPVYCICVYVLDTVYNHTFVQYTFSLFCTFAEAVIWLLSVLVLPWYMLNQWRFTWTLSVQS